MAEVMDSVLTSIFAEGRQFMSGYRRKFNDSVGKVILIGGGALLSGIIDLAVKNFEAEEPPKKKV